ncbi:MAG: nucleotidyl transferase AbiEii/AbiGii toxin family protein [Gammaproteobacteria bacterium]
MFERPHHQRIAQLLRSLNGDLLSRCACYFGGGTAIVLALGEYRESLDIDFLCASTKGYRTLRNIAFDHGIEGFFETKPQVLREMRSDQYGIRTFLTVDELPVRFEIIREARIPLSGRLVKSLGVPRLGRVDMFASKLLANADRYNDRASAHRDIIDLAMMVHHWGDIPQAAWDKAQAAYGDIIPGACRESLKHLQDVVRLRASMETLTMDIELLPIVQLAMQQIANQCAG